MVSFFWYSGWYQCIWCILDTIKVIKGNTFAHTTRIAWCCLFSYFISELRRDGLWACPQLSSYSWWGYEYNVYLCWQNYTFNFWEKLMYVSYTTDRPRSSVGQPEGALALICLWVLWHGWLTLMGCVVRMTLLPGEFSLLQCAWEMFGLDTSTHAWLWSIADHYIIKRHSSHAWYGCWAIKALVEAEVNDGFTLSFQGIAVPLIIARPLGVSILLRENRQNLHVFNLWPVIYHTKKNSCANPTPETLSVEIYTSQHDYPKSTRFYFVAIGVS